jgi:hypothetical protein
MPFKDDIVGSIFNSPPPTTFPKYTKHCLAYSNVCRFCFSKKKKGVATFQKFSVYFCKKISEIGCIYKFLSEKHAS